MSALERALRLKPDHEEARYALGITLRIKGDSGTAAEHLKAVGDLRQFRARLAESKSLILAGVEKLKQDRSSDALKDSRRPPKRALRLPPGSIFERLAYDRLGEADKAFAAYQRALELQPDYAQAQVSLGA